MQFRSALQHVRDAYIMLAHNERASASRGLCSQAPIGALHLYLKFWPPAFCTLSACTRVRASITNRPYFSPPLSSANVVKSNIYDRITLIEECFSNHSHWPGTLRKFTPCVDLASWDNGFSLSFVLLITCEKTQKKSRRYFRCSVFLLT